MFSTARRSLNVEEFRITAEQGHLMEDKVISSAIGRYQHYFSRYVSCFMFVSKEFIYQDTRWHT